MSRSRARKQRDIDKYVMDVAQGYGNEFLKSLTKEQELQLAGMPHPKIPQSDLTAYDYIKWMCGKGWHKKAKKVFEELRLS
ncbi:hypothetical protein OAE23_01520 [Synechococcus sp. AH-551-E11]|nr:hypothetical protein [Synechococcus sp. AH-551-E11]